MEAANTVTTTFPKITTGIATGLRTIGALGGFALSVHACFI
jgi:hypothetical protein